MGCVCGKDSSSGAFGNANSGLLANFNSSKAPKEDFVMVDDLSGDLSDDGGDKLGVSDADIGLPRLARLSSQYLPASGCKITQVPDGNFELRFSFLSQRGYYPEALDKANQDSFCVHTHFGKNPNDHFFGVFDGHGEFGAECSQFAKKHLCENLLKHGCFTADVVQAYQSAFITTNLQLHRSQVDDSMSGTTAITVLVRGKTLYVANVGDSRAVLAERINGKLTAVDLSSDQTPFRTDECERVKTCGARVLTLDQLEGLKSPALQCWGGEEDDDGDPPRLWVANGMYPGTAFTRSIGDTVAERIGVIAVPEVASFEINGTHPFFVLASDGVFEFLSSQDVVDMVAKHKDPRDACAAIVAESYRLWLQYETRTDDITIIVVNIDGLEEENHNQNAVFHCKGAELPFKPRDYSEPAEQVRPASHEVSAAKLRAIEASLEHQTEWVPPSEQQIKTDEEKARIKHALQGNFLFHNLTEKQWETLYNCFEKVQVQPGKIIIRQGAEDDHFYIVESGKFDVLVAQDENQSEDDLGTIVNQYTAYNSPCFGELALMYNKPRQASIRAVTEGTLWMLGREAFRGLLSMNTRRSALKHLRAVEVLATLNIAQLVRLADSLSEVSFRDGAVIAQKGAEVSTFYLLRKGFVDVKHHGALENLTDRKGEGDYFGEWVLRGEPSRSLTAVAVGDVECWAISRETLEKAVGQLDRVIEDNMKLREKILSLRKQQSAKLDTLSITSDLGDLEWQETVYTTDCCEVGLVSLKKTGQVFSMKRYPLEVIKALGRESQVLQEKFLFQDLSPSLYVPQVVCTSADERYAAMLLNCALGGPLSLILNTPLSEDSARFIGASVAMAIDSMHKDGVVYRGVSPDMLMLDRKGRLQLADFRFGKKLLDERAYTICGMADFLAPEIIRGQGHGFGADWWALGVLLYYMVQNELPFGSWRDSELDIYSKIAGRQLVFPSTFSGELVDLIDKLLVVDVSQRLGSRGMEEIKAQPWFAGLDWEALLECRTDVPFEVLSRLQSALKTSRADDSHHLLISPSATSEESSAAPQWLENW
ncbi:protein phosphatase 2C and cyclic nucleotide-binding/kinase domain-containing protein isoform X1 [Selaginella moellendorffii]|uniref:protein phosphatase 2C and cyclic nucleotide-binding/kinase domain-containing protein isoform X1 n=1 Tax=Selaginella moellendorffii TaxID=88036 RepID=UPI000D1CDCF3|nr:protein phosphatase 2C and cyclic nucleotide-binding/kinase domain-containing protein isoform X1 [Selaginella moellendorffii]|eukprot:XP_024528984.1 protein phosphatase 2C and cyclic nucleotide-binding/kinase domain-containing protein isoform X1 [Selaginella moellendorffii]